ncbi:MAG: nucleotide exchange factor GrpE [Clostridia bacterium]
MFTFYRLKGRRATPKVKGMQEETIQPQDGGQNQAPGQKSLEDLLSEAQSKIEQQREAMLRAVAEADNTRKRVQAEATATAKYAIERFAQALLPVVDSLEAAIAAGRDTAGPMREGLEITLRQLKSAFEKFSLAEINPPAGERFDPHRHQAMATVEAEGEPNAVAAVMQKGYALHERILRPALVTVTRPPVEKGDGNPISDTDLD